MVFQVILSFFVANEGGIVQFGKRPGAILENGSVIGKIFALKKYDQSTLNTSCFGGITGLNITLLCNFTKFLQ